MSVFELDQHFWILNKSPVSDAWWLLGKLIICSHKNAHLFYPTPSECKGQSCFLRIHSLKLFNALDNTHGISWSYKGTKYSTAEQVSFSQTDEAALSRRGFTATALPRGRPGVLKGKWNQQHYCPGPCCIPPPAPLELIKFSKGLVNVFSLNLRTALHSAVLSPLGNCRVVHSGCWGSHREPLAWFFLPNKQHFLLHFIAISLTNMKGIQLLFRHTNYLQDDIWNLKIFWSTQAIMTWCCHEISWNLEIKFH